MSVLAAVAVLLVGAAPCELAVRKEAIAVAVRLTDGGFVIDDNAAAFKGLTYQAVCAAVGAKFLASEDPIERAAAAVYGVRFKQAGEKTVTIPIVSDFVGPVTIMRYQHYFAIGKPELAQILAHAKDETNPLVVIEQLRSVSTLAGVEPSLQLLRGAEGLVARSVELRRDAQWFRARSGVGLWRASVTSDHVDQAHARRAQREAVGSDRRGRAEVHRRKEG